MTVMVMNTAASFRELPAPHARRKPDPSKKITALKAHTLFPGVNEVGDEEWDEAMKLPVIQHLVEEGVLKVITPEGKKKPAATLADLKPKEQLKMVEETTNIELLESWKADAPANVAKAIDARIDDLKGPKKE